MRNRAQRGDGRGGRVRGEGRGEEGMITSHNCRFTGNSLFEATNTSITSSENGALKKIKQNNVSNELNKTKIRY